MTPNRNLEDLKKDRGFCKRIKEYQELNKKVEELDKIIGNEKVGLEIYNQREEVDIDRNIIARTLLNEIIENLFSETSQNDIKFSKPEQFNGDCIVRIDYGYNGLVSNKLYFANIHKNIVNFYADSQHEYWIPQRLSIDDVIRICNPSTEEINEAATNGTSAYKLYMDGEKRYQELKEKNNLKNDV